MKKILLFIFAFIVLITAGCNKIDKSGIEVGVKETPRITDNAQESPQGGDMPEATENPVDRDEFGLNPTLSAIPTNSDSGSTGTKTAGNTTPMPKQSPKPSVKPVNNNNIPAPQKPNINRLTENEFVLTWEGGSGRYQVKISTDNKNFSNYGSITSDKFIILNDLKPDKNYYIRIYSVDSENNITNKYVGIGYKYSSSTSTPISSPNNGHATPTKEPTQKPVDDNDILYAEVFAVDTNSAIIYWSGLSEKYQVKISTDNKNFSNYGGVTSNSYCILENLKDGTTYYVRVYSVKGNNTLSSTYKSITFKTEEIKKPSNLKIKELGYTYAEISWSGNSEYYLVMLSTNGKDYKEVENTFFKDISITNLQDNTKYWVKVYNSDNNGKIIDPNKYEVIEFTTKSMPLPSNLSVSSVTLRSARFSWSGGTGSYYIAIEEANNPGKDIDGYYRDSKAIEISLLKPNTRYLIKLHSVDADVISKGYISLEFTTQALPVPKNLKVSHVSPRGALLTWTAEEDFSYLVKISTDGINFVDYGNILYSQSRKELINLNENTTYWVQVYALDAPAILYDEDLGQPAQITFKTGIGNITKQDSTYTTYLSSNNKKDYLEIKLLSAAIEFKGATMTGYDKVNISIQKTDGSYFGGKTITIASDKTFYYKNSDNLKDGNYSIYVSFGPDSSGYYWTHHQINFTKKSGKMYFTQSEVYNHNYENYRANNYFTFYSIESSLNESDQKKIKDLALSITKGINSDYEKALAISTWVSQNIYYDMDMFNNTAPYKVSAIETLENKRSVCQGYANLTAELLKAVNIPCKVVTGYAMGLGTDGDWSKVGKDVTNHAWNEAYIDGRWVIIDTTWNSCNTYEKGKYYKKDPIYKYFDITLEALSYSHRIYG